MSGILRLSSGLPFALSDGNGWATNWEYESYQVQTGPVNAHKTIRASDRTPFAFAPAPVTGTNMRDPYPGEAGERNFYRGDGYFNVDAGLHKVIKLGEKYSFSLAGEIFNVSNSVRFDVHSLDTGSTDGAQLGAYSTTLTTPRRMQFSGRFDF